MSTESASALDQSLDGSDALLVVVEPRVEVGPSCARDVERLAHVGAERHICGLSARHESGALLLADANGQRWLALFHAGATEPWPSHAVSANALAVRRCARDSDWCDGVICKDHGIDCENADG